MVYCTRLDVKTALAPGATEAANADATAVNLPTWQIDDAIAEATGVVRLHVAGRYTVPEPDAQVTDDPTADPVQYTTQPLAPYPVGGWTRNIAAYLLTLTHKRNQDLDENDPIRLRYDMTMSMLGKILDGSLDLEFDEVDNDSQGVHVENLYEGKLFQMSDVGLGPEGYPQSQVLWPRRSWNHGA